MFFSNSGEQGLGGEDWRAGREQRLDLKSIKLKVSDDGAWNGLIVTAWQSRRYLNIIRNIER